MRAALCPEVRVLLLSAGGTGNDGAIAELLGPGFDWERLTRAAARERAAAVLWARVGALLDVVPEEAEPLRRLARVSGFRQARLRGRLLDVIDALGASGVRPVLLKGAALASTVYPTFTERPMGDLDLLLPHERIEEAVALLLTEGWRWTADAQRCAFYAHHHHIAPLEDDAGTRLELHTDLFPPGHPFRILPAHRLFAIARDARFEGRVIRVLPTECMLLHACLHFAWSHAMERGAWVTFRDIGALLEVPDADARGIPALCRRVGGALPCYWALRLARTLSGISVPEAVVAALRPRIPDAVLGVLERHFTLQLATGGEACPSMRLARAMWHLGCVGLRGRDGLRPWEMGEAFARAGPPDADAASTPIRRRPLRQWRRYLTGAVS